MYGCIFKCRYELEDFGGILFISHGFGIAVLMYLCELKKTIYRENGKRTDVVKHGSQESSLTTFRTATLFIVCMAFNRMLLCLPAQ